ncbi:MAG: SMI1/KNR4 family protein [Planctomycetota bacterium]
MRDLLDTGPELAEGEVAALEQRLGAALPSDYRSFLLASNGGVPEPNCVDVPGHPEAPTDLQEFFGITQTVETSNIEWHLDVLTERLEKAQVPIACDSGGNTFCISVRPGDRGQIVYLDLQRVAGDYGAAPEAYPVAQSFTEFLGKLTDFDEA